MKEKYVLIDVGEFGFSAHAQTADYGYGKTKSRLSGYDRDIDRIVKDHKDELVTGCIIVDKAGPKLYQTSPTFVKDVMSSPLPDPDLEPGEIDACPQPSEMLLFGLQGSFKTLYLIKAIDKKWTGLDYVSLIDYAAYWAKRGAKVGIWNGESIDWHGQQDLF